MLHSQVKHHSLHWKIGLKALQCKKATDATFVLFDKGQYLHCMFVWASDFHCLNFTNGHNVEKVETLAKGPFTLSIRVNAAMLRYHWLNYLDFFLNQASHSKNGLLPQLIRNDVRINVNAPN